MIYTEYLLLLKVSRDDSNEMVYLFRRYMNSYSVLNIMIGGIVSRKLNNIEITIQEAFARMKCVF